MRRHSAAAASSSRFKRRSLAASIPARTAGTWWEAAAGDADKAQARRIQKTTRQSSMGVL
jgi:hypothetical protein